MREPKFQYRLWIDTLFFCNIARMEETCFADISHMLIERHMSFECYANVTVSDGWILKLDTSI